MTSFVASLILAAVAAPAQAGGVSLAWKMKAGDTFYARSAMNIEQTITINGRDVDQKQDQASVSRYKVTKVGPDGYTLEQTILQSSVESNIQPGGADDVTKKIRGATFTITLDAKFKVQKVDGIDELVTKLGGDDPKAKAMLSATLNEEVMKKSVQDMFYCGPDDSKAVKVGDTWKRDTKLPMGPIGDMDLTMEYKYAGSKGGKEDVALSGSAKYAPPKKAAGGAALPFTVKDADLKTDKLTGTLTFDSTAGRMTESKLEMEMSGSMTIAVNGREATMDLKQKLVGKTTILDKNPVVD